MSDEKEISPIQVIKRAIGTATFSHTDIGGLVFSLLDSLDSDMIGLGVDEFSETTESISQELVNTLAGDLDDYRTDLEEEDDDEVEPYTEDDVDENSPILMRDEEDDEDDEEEFENFRNESLESENEDENEDEEESAILQSYDHLGDEGETDDSQKPSTSNG